MSDTRGHRSRDGARDIRILERTASNRVLADIDHDSVAKQIEGVSGA